MDSGALPAPCSGSSGAGLCLHSRCLFCVLFGLARGRLPEAGVQAVPDGICLRGITGLLVSLPYPDGGRIFCIM